MKRLYKSGKITKANVKARVKSGKITANDYDDEKPTDDMVEYANKAVDEYTLQLIEEWVI